MKKIKLEKLGISFNDLRFFVKKLESNDCLIKRRREIITDNCRYIAPEIISAIRRGEKSIYDYIAPPGAYQEI